MLHKFLFYKYKILGLLSTVDFSFLQEEITGEDPLAEATDIVKNLGRSSVTFLQVVGIIALVISIMFTGMGLVMTKNAAKRDENKSHLGWIIIGGILFFGVFVVVSMIQGFSGGIG